MPAETAEVLRITCDNPACPGNDLDPADRTGWLFISSEVYGTPSVQSVFCCADCAGAASDLLVRGSEEVATAKAS